MTAAAYPSPSPPASVCWSIERLDALNWVLPLVPRDRRAAVRAVLDFRAELHATANSPASRSEKRARFASWRRELDALEAGLPATPQTIALEGPLRRHRMPRVELENMVIGLRYGCGRKLCLLRRYAIYACTAVAPWER